MLRFIIGDLLTGRRIQTIPVLTGSWSEVLNDAGDISATVPLRNAAVRRLHLSESAAVGKAFLAVLDGDSVLQAGPIWQHRYDGNTQQLTLTAGGMWTYFDHRVLIPVLAGRNPTNSATDTNFTNTSLHDIAKALVAQAQTATGGNVPIVLPDSVPGTNQRSYKGADLGLVSDRLTELTQVEQGPDIHFLPRLTSDRMGVEWAMRIGTPDQPLLFSEQDVVFNTGVAASSVSNIQVVVDGTSLASQAFASGGRTDDTALITVSTDPLLTNNGYPLLEAVDSSHSSVSLTSTLQAYSDEMVLAGRTPVWTVTFDHDASKRPFVGSFLVGDFARVTFKGDPYIPDGRVRLRITSRSGDESGRTVSLQFQPEVI